MSLRILVLLILVLPLSAKAETLVGKVVGVTDGDTIKVLVEERTIKVRLAEIDTPERGQPWASRAKQALSDKVFGDEIEVRVVTIDRYGRTVGHLWIGDRSFSDTGMSTRSICNPSRMLSSVMTTDSGNWLMRAAPFYVINMTM